MKVDEVAQKGFALHQTFPPRFGWLKKAFDNASFNGKVFSDEAATVTLGVGKNMVEAIAFWAQAFRILDVEKPANKKESSRFVPTAFGTLMFDENNGLDPYLEIPHSLWLLHWMSLQPTTKLPAWWLTFSEFGRTEFSIDELVEFVFETVLSTSWKYDNQKAILRDVDCLLRMYSPRLKKSRLTIDDYLDSPFRDLGIIGPSSLNKGEYRFQQGDKPNLDGKLVALACVHFMSQLNTKSSTVPHLLNDSGSPGRIFQLTESTLSGYLKEGIRGVSGVDIATPSGVDQLVLDKDHSEIIKSLLALLYPAVMIDVPLNGKIISSFSNHEIGDAQLTLFLDAENGGKTGNNEEFVGKRRTAPRNKKPQSESNGSKEPVSNATRKVVKVEKKKQVSTSKSVRAPSRTGTNIKRSSTSNKTVSGRKKAK